DHGCPALVRSVDPELSEFGMTDGKLIQLMRILGDPQRFAIFRQLADAGDLPAGALRAKGLSAPATSYHLKEMTEGGLLKVARRKQERRYSINIETLDELARWAHSAVEDAGYARLIAYLEATPGEAEPLGAGIAKVQAI
ncbi:ArsR/SmtB family transcription factor, partial [Devosia psychrophila]|uniref:ArsR/SmtB family transcription factor n=2 Tax=Devosia psychrophila TaxID=728005 RepID=UPI00069C0FAB